MNPGLLIYEFIDTSNEAVKDVMRGKRRYTAAAQYLAYLQPLLSKRSVRENHI